MRPDMVKYFIMATLGASEGVVFHSNQPDTPNDCVTVYGEPEALNVHSDVYLTKYQALIRHTTCTTGESWARTILTAVKSMHTRKIYDGMYLNAAMNNSSDPVTFAPDDNGGTPATKAGSFAANDYVLIDSEILKVSSVASPNVVAARAQLGTAKAVHADNAEVFNLTKSPVPGELCDSARATSGVLSLGVDEKNFHEFTVNWEVTLKRS